MMTTTKVDLVVYENGKRKVIGEAILDLLSGNIAGHQHLDVSGVVTDPEYKLKLSDRSAVSLNVGVFCEESVKIEGSIPLENA